MQSCMLRSRRMRLLRRSALIAVLLACTAAPAAAADTLQTFDLPSPGIDTAKPGGTLEKRRAAPRIHVQLPDGYDARASSGYPVLWLLHGANGGTDSWLSGLKKFWADFPGIIVMPDGGKFGMYMDWWNAGARGGPAWASYHLGTLRDEIERRYPIRPGRRWHAIGGISMGGQGTLRYAAMLPGYFGSAAGLSAALPDMRTLEAQFGVELAAKGGGYGASFEAIYGPARGPYAEGNSAQALTPNLGHTRLYVTSGNGINCPGDPATGSYALDIVTEAFINFEREPFAAAARRYGADVTSVGTCGVHTFGVWDRAIPLVRKWGFFEPVEEAPRRWTYRTIAQRGEAWDLRFAFAAPPAEVARFDRDGDRLRGGGSGTVTLTNERGCSVSAALPFDVAVPPDACGQRLRLTAKRRSSRLDVRVTYDARAGRLPLAGVTVQARGARVRRSARTDAHGRARIRMAGRKAVRLRAAKRGYRAAALKLRR